VLQNPAMSFKLKKLKGQGDEAIVYELKLNNPHTFNSIRLKEGTYILKNYKRKPLFDLNELINLSKKRLIPKVYVVDGRIVIMDFVKGITFQEFLDKKYSENIRKKVFKNLKNLLQKWHNYDKRHCDLNFYNILVTNKYDVYFIDPMLNRCDINSDQQELSEIKKYLKI
jgi:RIO-like serine/threonine protein kinase